MLEQVKKAFEGKEPGRGGYGSEFVFSPRKAGEVEGVLLELEAEWLPRCETPSVFVTKVEGDVVTFWDCETSLESDEVWLADGSERTLYTEGVVELLADYGAY